MIEGVMEMAFINQLDNIFNDYYNEYTRPLNYFDPRNVSQGSEKNLFNEHNQTL